MKRGPITPSDGAPCSLERRMSPARRTSPPHPLGGDRPVLGAAVRRSASRALGVVASAALLLALLAVQPTAALAAAAAKATGDDAPLDLGGAESAGGQQVGPGGGSIARVIVGLLIVVAVIYGVTWILKQLKGGKRETATAGGLEQVTTMPLQGGGALSLVRIGDELLLLGSGANGATTLRRYDEDEARALGLWPDDDGAPTEDPPSGGAPGGNVLAILGRTFSALWARTHRAPASPAAPTTFTAPGAGPLPGERAPVAPSFVAALLDRLRAMTVRG